MLDDLVENYNDTIHGSTNTRPKVAMRTGQTFPKRARVVINDIKIGDQVRIIVPRTIMTKGDVPYYSKKIYEVVGRDMNRFIVKNIRTNIEKKKRFGRHQLYKIKGSSLKKFKNNDDALGYDEGINRNARRNRHDKALQKNSIDLEKIVNPVEREHAKMLRDQVAPIPKYSDDDEPPHADDISPEWDTLHVSKYSKMPTNKNGACFFNSLAGFLHWEDYHKALEIGGTVEGQMSRYLRNQTVEYMKNHLNSKIPNLDETFEENITRQLETENDDRSTNEYLRDMLKTSEWAGQSEIIASGLHLKRNILVYVKRDDFYKKYGGYIFDNKNNEMITLFWNQRDANSEGNHYEYLVKKPRRSFRLREHKQRHRHRHRHKSLGAPNGKMRALPAPKPKRKTSELQHAKPRDIKILAKSHKSSDNETAGDWQRDTGFEQVGQWVRDKNIKGGWLLLVKFNNEVRYKGVYGTMDDVDNLGKFRPKNLKRLKHTVNRLNKPKHNLSQLVLKL